MMIHCPTCGKKVFDTHEMPETEPFTATNPMHGLEVWGPYSAKKTILCQGRTWIHFQVNCEERLVELGVPLSEMDETIEEDEDDDLLTHCPKCYAAWGIEEMSFQECDACGYGSGPDDDDDHDDYWKEGDDDLPF